MTRTRRWLPWAAALTAALALGACSANGPDSGSGDGAEAGALLTIPREDMGTFTRNFNPFSPNVAPMTQQAIYESMLIYNPAAGETIPWLATEWEAAEDGTGLTFTLRDDVSWSDGEPLVAADVVTTFELSQELQGGFPYVTAIEAVDEQTVEFTFERPYSPALWEIGQQIILPDHIWSQVEDPANETNETPVGTGPYTEVSNFQAQSFDLLPNPSYWQPDKQKIPGIRMLAFAGNDGANLAAIEGEVDWAPQFIPDIQTAYVDRDPEHRQYWFPPTGSTIQWTLNTTKAPFDDVEFRQAVSLAIDRDQITQTGMFGYAQPADCTGLSGAFEDWKDSAVLESCAGTDRDVEAANALLDEAGYTAGSDGTRTLPDGSPLSFSISVGATSSDWLSVAQIITQNLAEVGITATVDSPDWSQVVQGLENGDFDSAIAWSGNGPTPYAYYRSVMSTETVKPVGEQTFENYHRFGDPEATQLLEQFAASFDEAEQHELANQLQARYAELLPAVPLFPGPEWGAFTDVRFTGWPTEDNPYATLATRSPTTVLVLTTLEPVS